MSSNRYLPETMGSGVAFFDYDNDGWIDIFMVNSGAADFYQPAAPLKNALYKNNRDGTFTDVTDKAGVAGGHAFGMGRAIADYDNDGKLDLFLCSFVEFSLASNMFCGDNKLGKRFYCIPRVFKPTLSFLHRNNGDGTFTEVSGGTDIQRVKGEALGVVATDINGDGLMDPFVANDTVQNFLFANPREGEMGGNRARRRGWFQRTSCNRDAIGATMTWSCGDTIRRRYKSSGGSYLSSHDRREVLGIGTATKVNWIEITWPPPSGRVERLTDVPIDRYVTIEGQGRIKG